MTIWAELVDTELVGKEDRELKFLQEQLDAAQRLYEVHREPIRSSSVWVSLYRNRRRVVIGEDKQSLLLCSFFYNVANRDLGYPGRPRYARGRLRDIEVQRCGWYWLRNLPRVRLLNLSARLIKHDNGSISHAAAELMVSLATRDDLPFITGILIDDDSLVRQAAEETFGQACHTRRPSLHK